MLKRKKPGKQADTNFVVCDIENRANGEVFWIQTYDGENHYTHYNWGDWLDFIEEKAGETPRFQRIYAHNGGGWDWLSFAAYYLERKGQTVRFNMVGSKLLLVSLPVSEDITIQLCDSMNLFYTSLDKAAKAFVGEGKVTIDVLPEKLFATDKEKFLRYVKADTELLYRSVIRFAEILYALTGVGKLGITLPATAMAVFRTRFLAREIWIPTEDKLKQILREGYRGGRVECFRPGHHKNVRVYDINSLYPSVMRKIAVPTSAKGFWTTKLHLAVPSVYRVRFTQTNRKIKPVLMVNGEGAYEGSGVFFSPELQLLKEVDKRAKIEVVEGFVFVESHCLFRAYVDTLYAKRMEDKGGPMGEICKRLLNSLYGKFGQKTVRESLFVVESGEELAELVAGGATVRPINLALDLYSIEEETECFFEHVGIAGMITSASRVALYRYFTPDIVYCDTDSVHVTRGTTLPTSAEIGELKCEFEGEGVYLGKKLYALKNSEKEKLRVKGVSVGGKFGASIDFEKMVGLVAGKSLRCYYQTPTTPREVFVGKAPCVFRNRSRTIKRTSHV